MFPHQKQALPPSAKQTVGAESLRDELDELMHRVHQQFELELPCTELAVTIADNLEAIAESHKLDLAFDDSVWAGDSLSDVASARHAFSSTALAIAVRLGFSCMHACFPRAAAVLEGLPKETARHTICGVAWLRSFGVSARIASAQLADWFENRCDAETGNTMCNPIEAFNVLIGVLRDGETLPSPLAEDFCSILLDGEQDVPREMWEACELLEHRLEALCDDYDCLVRKRGSARKGIAKTAHDSHGKIVSEVVGQPLIAIEVEDSVQNNLQCL